MRTNFVAIVLATATTLAGCGRHTTEVGVSRLAGGTKGQVPRSNINIEHDNVELVGATEGLRQQFLNNLNHLDLLKLKFHGPVVSSTPVTVTLRGPCDLVLATSSVTIDEGQIASGAWAWIDVPFDVDVPYGQYLTFEVTTPSYNPTVVLNQNRYELGRMLDQAVWAYGFPYKKRDLMFQAIGQADESTDWTPHVTTNVICPDRCRVVGTEHNAWNVRNHFNVAVVGGSSLTAGSFFSDYLAGDLAALSNDVREALEGDSANPGIRETAPFAELYPEMNFYLAVADPAVDTRREKGIPNCANIDAFIYIVEPPAPYGGGSFNGGIVRPAIGAHGWGPSQRRDLRHEVFGHGIGHLTDEYVSQAAWSYAAPYHLAFTPNSVPIGCPSWCTSYTPMKSVANDLSKQGFGACFAFDDAECVAHSAECFFVGGIVPPVSYYDGVRCVPKQIVLENIGRDCLPDTGCYIGAPLTTSPPQALNVAQPNSQIMQSGHVVGTGMNPGFAGGPERTMRTLMACMFPLTCAGYDAVGCAAFEAQWSTTPGYEAFAQFGSACEGTTYRRR